MYGSHRQQVVRHGEGQVCLTLLPTSQLAPSLALAQGLAHNTYSQAICQLDGRG